MCSLLLKLAFDFALDEVLELVCVAQAALRVVHFRFKFLNLIFTNFKLDRVIFDA